MKLYHLTLVIVLLSVLFAVSKSQDGDWEYDVDEDGNNRSIFSRWWSRLKEVAGSAFSAVREIWDSFKEEVRSRTTDFQEWWREMKDSFLARMDKTDMSERDKQRLLQFMEKQLPEDR